MKKFIAYITILIAIICASNCANMSPSLGGGPKDTIPPIVLKEIPRTNDTNVNIKRVEITFDEYVKIKDAKDFIVSPPLKSSPQLFTRGKRVIAQFDSALNENTTYLFDFGSAIVDLNEGNPLGNYRLIFSTGNVLDSLHFSGRARHAFTFDSVKNMKVLLYSSDVDSLPFTTQPDAVSRVSNRGFFVVDALKNQPYRIIALEDKNNNNIYDADEMVGFLDSMITPISFSADTMNISSYELDTTSNFEYLPLIRIFQENINKQYLSDYKRDQERKAVLSFAQRNAEILSIAFLNSDSIAIDSTKIITETSFFGDTITYWFAVDSVPQKMHGKIVYMKPDSIGNEVPTETILRFKDFVKPNPKKPKKGEEEETPKLQIAIRANENLVIENGFDLVFNAPLTKMDYEKINLYEFDEAQNSKLVPFEIIADSSNLCQYIFQADTWKSETTYEAEFLSGAFTDIYNLENDSVRKRIQTPDPEKFSSIILTFTNVECNYIVQLMKGKRIVQTKQMNQNGNLAISFIAPETYSLRIIEDNNNNNRWDEGSLKERRQPERVKMYKLDDGQTTIKLRQGWENVLPIDLKTFFDD